jgi:hypothetical protein
MDNLIIKETNYSPHVSFTIDGDLILKGKSLPEDTAKFYDPILTWAKDCTLEKIHITFHLDYMNSSSANQVSKFLLIVKDNVFIKECIIDWHYETNDEDNLDFGKELETITEFKFNFFEYAEA